MAQIRMNLKGVTTLLVDSDNFTRGIVAQILRGFGMDSPAIFTNGREAKDFLKHNMVDLCVVEAVLPDMEGSDLIRWIRHREKSPLRFVPIIVLSGYTQLGKVAVARDSGANLVVKKPVSPQVLFDHLAWVGRLPRPFIEAGEYAGPDRRFKTVPPPDGIERRADAEQNASDDQTDSPPSDGSPRQGSSSAKQAAA